MRFRTLLGKKFRRNGHVCVAKDPSTGYYDIFLYRTGSKREWIEDTRNRQVAVKRAKELAMSHQLDFNQDTDLIY
jgi:hypothetical protein